MKAEIKQNYSLVIEGLTKEQLCWISEAFGISRTQPGTHKEEQEFLLELENIIDN